MARGRQSACKRESRRGATSKKTATKKPGARVKTQTKSIKYVRGPANNVYVYG